MAASPVSETSPSRLERASPESLVLRGFGTNSQSVVCREAALNRAEEEPRAKTPTFSRDDVEMCLATIRRCVPPAWACGSDVVPILVMRSWR